ncbi:hypothetical protein V5O48_012179 [Marasmius crinis-equi]|uniref:F-box domain-containing protein n=1 Tax=Marasmius crinis-equi TaxID=585013 RepID=A0ABR3F3N3_9AGAR
MSTISAFPHLPNELIEKIISNVWSSTLSLPERALFIKSSFLVSSSWRSIFERVYYQDVHILSTAHASEFLNSFLHGESSQLLDQFCRSITMEHANRALFPGPESVYEQPMGLAIYTILSNISKPDRLPNLRRISLQLENYLMETIFTNDKVLYMPHQVRELEVDFTYSEDTDPLTIMAIKHRGGEIFDIPTKNLASIRSLKVFGASTAVTRELLAICGGEGNLDVFEQDAWKVVKPVAPIATPSSPPAPAGSLSDDDANEVFYDCDDSSWKGYEGLCASSFTKEELIRILNAAQSQLAA